VVLKDASGKVIFQLGKKLGRQTNNVAEYYALLAALDYAVGQGIKGLRIRSDSELLVQQMRGRYKVKSPDLKPLHERASKLARQLEYFVIEHVPREMNLEADALANQALDGGATRYEGAREAREPAGAGVSNLTARHSDKASVKHSDTQDAGQKQKPPVSKAHTIRARLVNGTLVPWEPLDLAEGSVVVITIRKA
jgi:ribonuclease HI